VEELADAEGVIDADVESEESSTAATTDDAPPAELPTPTDACLASATLPASSDLGLPDGPNTAGVFVAKPTASANWADARSGSVRFAYLTATDGKSTTEKHFQSNWSLLNECGILRGAVHHYRSSKGIEDQARAFITALSGDMGELPPAISLDGKHRSIRDCESYVEGLVTLSQTIEDQLSIPPVILTSAAFWNDTLKCTTDTLTDQRARTVSAYPLWIRDDDGSGGIPGHWHRADFVELDQTISLGSSKLNVETYNGSDHQLLSWATGLRN
jgi:hypothetical protein